MEKKRRGNHRCWEERRTLTWQSIDVMDEKIEAMAILGIATHINRANYRYCGLKNETLAILRTTIHINRVKHRCCGRKD